MEKRNKKSIEIMERFLETGTLWQELGNNQIFIRLAGISGALAVIFAAYGAHGHDFGDNTERFRTGNLIHFYHTLALLAVPLSKRPILVRFGTVFFLEEEGETKVFCVKWKNFDFDSIYQ